MKEAHIVIGFLVVVLGVVFFIPSANARSATLIIQPKQETIEEFNATTGNAWSVSIAGKVLANNSIDFYATDPSGAKLLSYNDTSNTTFSFAPQENGTYQLHIANTYSTENVTAELSYGFGYETTSNLNLNVGMTAESNTLTITVIPSPPDDPRLDQENLYAKHLDFLKASEILTNLDGTLQRILPINRIPFAAVYALSMLAFGVLAIMGHSDLVGRNGQQSFKHDKRNGNTIIRSAHPSIQRELKII